MLSNRFIGIVYSHIQFAYQVVVRCNVDVKKCTAPIDLFYFFILACAWCLQYVRKPIKSGLSPSHIPPHFRSRYGLVRGLGPGQSSWSSGFLGFSKEQKNVSLKQWVFSPF